MFSFFSALRGRSIFLGWSLMRSCPFPSRVMGHLALMGKAILLRACRALVLVLRVLRLDAKLGRHRVFLPYFLARRPSGSHERNATVSEFTELWCWRNVLEGRLFFWGILFKRTLSWHAALLRARCNNHFVTAIGCDLFFVDCSAGGVDCARW